MEETFNDFLEMKIECMGFITRIGAKINKKVITNYYANSTAEYINMYSIRKQQFIFCKYVISTYNTLPHNNISCIAFAHLVNKYMDFPVQIDPYITTELRRQ